MGYRVELLIDETHFFNGGSYGHAFIKLVNEDGVETVRGFYPDPEHAVPFAALAGYARAIIKDDAYEPYTRGRAFVITKEQYDAMMQEIETIKTYTEEGYTTYDLFDIYDNVVDFNCVTFAEHILNTGGINVELGVLPQLALSSSYANEFCETYYDNLSVHAGDGKPGAMVSYTNGYVLYTDGSWEHHTTVPSYSITTSYNDNNQTLSINTTQPIESNKGFANAFLSLTDQVQTSKVVINSQTFDIRNLTPLQLRNAIDGIDKVSFLLSNILIKVGEQIDLGAKGVYTVKSGDTLSVIAQNNGYVTKDLVKLNPWLFDAGRIHFNYPDKVLIAEAGGVNHFTCEKDSWHVEMNNREFKFKMEVA